MAAAFGGMPGAKPLAKLPEEGKRENKVSVPLVLLLAAGRSPARPRFRGRQLRLLVCRAGLPSQSFSFPGAEPDCGAARVGGLACWPFGARARARDAAATAPSHATPGQGAVAFLVRASRAPAQSVLEKATETASWMWTKAGELAGPATGFATSAAWFTFCAATLLAVPVLIEMQREAMLVVEKEQQSQQVEELQRQLAQFRNNQSITSTIGALVGAASGGSDAPAQGGEGASA